MSDRMVISIDEYKKLERKLIIPESEYTDMLKIIDELKRIKTKILIIDYAHRKINHDRKRDLRWELDEIINSKSYDSDDTIMKRIDAIVRSEYVRLEKRINKHERDIMSKWWYKLFIWSKP